MHDEFSQAGRRPGRRYATVAVAVLLLAAAFLLPVAEWATALEGWNRQHPLAGPAVFVAGGVVAAALFVPGSIIAMVAGYLYGLMSGSLLALAALTIGGWAALLAGRFLVRDWARSKIRASRTLTALDRAVDERGFVVVALARASLVMPYNLFSYVMGATGIRARPYVLGTLVGMIPPAALYGYLGTLARSVEDIRSGRLEGELPGVPLIVAGILVIVTVVVVLRRTASRVLREELEP